MEGEPIPSTLNFMDVSRKKSVAHTARQKVNQSRTQHEVANLLRGALPEKETGRLGPAEEAADGAGAFHRHLSHAAGGLRAATLQNKFL